MDIKYFIGIIRTELYFRGAVTLKDRRVHLNSIRSRLSGMGFSVAQVGPVDLVRQAWLAAVTVSGSPGRLSKALDTAKKLFETPNWEITDFSVEIIGAEEKLPEWEAP